MNLYNSKTVGDVIAEIRWPKRFSEDVNTEIYLFLALCSHLESSLEFGQARRAKATSVSTLPLVIHERFCG
jgi:hypothetical protein